MTVISGVVTLGGSPVEGAKIYLIDAENNDLVLTTTTNASGEYSFDVIGGTFHVAAEYDDMVDKWNAKSLPFLEAAMNDANLKAYWKFNQTSGAVTNDSQGTADLGSAADLTITGATYNQAAGPFNYSMLFDGTDDKAVAGTSVSQFNYLHNTSALWTMAFWARVPTHAQNDIFFDTGRFGTNGPGVVLWITNASSALGVAIGNGSGNVVSFASSNNYLPDTTNWHFYVLTYNQSLASDNLAIRRDNANLENATKTANTPSNSNALGALHIASRYTGDTSFLHAYFAEWSAWNEVLTTGKQSDLYRNGKGREIY